MGGQSFFLSSAPDNLTQFGAALRFYYISSRHTSFPQAKGKIGHRHQDM